MQAVRPAFPLAPVMKPQRERKQIVRVEHDGPYGCGDATTRVEDASDVGVAGKEEEARCEG